jgi:predicted nucleotidyltransferase
MTANIQNTAKQFANALKQHNVPFQSLYVFGSAVSGKRHKWSDIDVGVVGPPFGNDRIEETVTLQIIAHKVDPTLAPIPLRPEDMEDRFDPIGMAIRREGKNVTL